MEKLTDPALTNVSDDMVAQFQTKLHPTSAVGAFYAPPNDRTHAVMLAGVTSFFLFPAASSTRRSRPPARETSPSPGVIDVDPGPMGGAAKCGTAKTADITMGMCAWADCGSLEWSSRTTAVSTRRPTFCGPSAPRYCTAADA